MSLRDMIGPIFVFRYTLWGCAYYSPRCPWGWRHLVHIGPWIFIWGKMETNECERAMEAEGRDTGGKDG